jgi:adenylyltransferase/sulfurtransferase
LKQIGKQGQEALSKKSVAIVGLGALGSVSAELLVRAGVGKLVLFDHDVVELQNLQRQTLYAEKDVGRPKAEAAKRHLQRINSEAKIVGHVLNLNQENIHMLKANIVLDCTDNMETRFLINDFCLKNKIAWIHAAAVETRGNVFVILPGGPCFRCIYDKAEALEDCETAGLLSSCSAMVSSLQVTEAIKILLGKEPTKELIHVDVWRPSLEKIRVNKNRNCKACKGIYEHLNPGKQEFKISYCRTKAAVSVKPSTSTKLDLEAIKERYETIMDAGIVLVIKAHNQEIVVHDYGELLFKTTKNKDLIKKITKDIYSMQK